MASSAGGGRRPQAGGGWIDDIGAWTNSVVAVAVLLFLALPILVVVPMSFSSAEALTFPPPGFSLRWYESFFGDARWLQAARTSIIVAVASSTLAAVFGSAAAYGLVRGKWFGRGAIEANFLLPLIVPQVVVGMAFLVTLSSLGVVTSVLSLAILHCVITLPFAARVIVSALAASCAATCRSWSR